MSVIEWNQADEGLQRKWLEINAALKESNTDEDDNFSNIEESQRKRDEANFHIIDLLESDGGVPMEEVVLVKSEDDLCLLSVALQEKASTDVISLLLSFDHQKETLYQRDKVEDMLPIHHAIMHCADTEAVQLLLEADVKKETIYSQGTSSKYLPIHIAADRDVPPEIVQLLLEADTKNETIHDSSNIHKLLPIHLALNVKASGEVVELLLKADKTHETVSTEVLNVLLNGYPFSSSWVDEFFSEKLLRLILGPHSYENDAPGRVKLTVRTRGSKGMSKIIEDCSVPLYVYQLLMESIPKSTKLQRIINEYSSERHVVAVMLADFYANCVLICLFLHASVVYVSNGTAVGSLIVLYLLVFYFVLGGALKARAKGSVDMWNILNACKIILVLASTIVMHVDRTNFEQNRVLLCWTSAFVFLGMISFLRTTFQPYASFASGVLKICYVLLPFLVVSGLILLAFAYMYYITRHDTDCSSCTGDAGEECVCKYFTSLKDSFLVVYGYFVGGPEQTTDILDIVFGLVVIIIFLNVVIAIVSTAWEENSELSADADFWRYRFSFLLELRTLQKYLIRLKCSGKMEELGDRIDELGAQKVFDRVEWTRWPYNFVESNDDYEHPGQLSEEISKGLKDKSTAEKMREKLRRMKSFQADWKFSQTARDHTVVLCRFLKWFLFSGAFFVLGIITFGFFWPRRFRMFLFGRNYTTPDLQTVMRDEMSRKIANLESDIGTLNEQFQDLLKILKNKERQSTIMRRRSTKIEPRMSISHSD